MSAAASVRVFFEPKIAAHPPELYRFDAASSMASTPLPPRASSGATARTAFSWCAGCCRRRSSTPPGPS